jgi:hypothetical protein
VTEQPRATADATALRADGEPQDLGRGAAATLDDDKANDFAGDTLSAAVDDARWPRTVADG